MEPQDNKQLALRKAISAHEQAEAALADLAADASDTRYAEMAERLRRNLDELKAVAESSDPGERV